MQPQTRAARCQRGDNAPVLERDAAHVRLPGHDEYDAAVRFEHPAHFAQRLEHIQCVLGHSEKAIAPVLAIGSEFRARDSQRIPAKQLHRRSMVLMVVEHIDVRWGGNYQINMIVGQGQCSCVSVKYVVSAAGARQLFDQPRMCPERTMKTTFILQGQVHKLQETVGNQAEDVRVVACFGDHGA